MRHVAHLNLLAVDDATSPAGEVAGNEDVFLFSACIAITGLHGAQFDKSQNREIKALPAQNGCFYGTAFGQKPASLVQYE